MSADALHKEADPEAHGPYKVFWIPVFVTGVIAFLVFAVTLGGTFIYDDIGTIVTDPRVHTPGRWVELLYTGYRSHNPDKLYRPLTNLSFVLEWRLHGGQPWLFHLTNLLLYASVTASVAALAGRLWGSRAGWIAGLLFAVHPVHTEVVAGLVGRSELLCALATFVALTLSLTRPLRPWRLVALVTCVLVALFSKEQGMLLPLLILLAFVFNKPVSQTPAERSEEKPRLLLLGAILLWLLVGYILLRERLVPMGWDRTRIEWAINPIIYSSGLQRWLLPVVVVGRYLALLVWPARLSLDYSGEVVGNAVRFNEPYIYLGFIAILVWIAVLFWSIKRKAWPTVFCLLAFIVMYGVVSNFGVRIGTVMGERLIFIPSGFFLALVAAAVTRWPKRLMIPLVAVLVVMWTIRSSTYARMWNDIDELYDYSLESQPTSVKSYARVVHQAGQRNNWRAALRVSEACRDQLPNDPNSYLLIADCRMRLGLLDQVTPALQAAAERGAASEDLMMAYMALDDLQTKHGMSTRPAARQNASENDSSNVPTTKPSPTVD